MAISTITIRFKDLDGMKTLMQALGEWANEAENHEPYLYQTEMRLYKEVLKFASSADDEDE